MINLHELPSGPLPRTVGDFWHMIWQEKVQFIVMLTNLMEEKKKKCARYWPENPRGCETYGQFSVTNLEEEGLLHFVIRTLRVEVRHVQHLFVFHNLLSVVVSSTEIFQ